ncbi:hypothetical protein COCCADRAFT_110855 [Bipolaris zeicola 26-R-13]|uniref:Uncharacterized protein n=1 Tax=Cochliobolus carbonum (strain 26-R-13) TaxID=930089 RepID=W6XKN1_COCC2|nr:uncharacterized protein COCCADRAFT_110855 [Bipolaris zeicola 26-R-13]EUC27757.1 hypothetical protein COCCADRAFT_110855 [Bipolaris zeicola 26-R-13]
MPKQAKLVNGSIVCAAICKATYGRSNGRSSHVCCGGWCGSVHDTRAVLRSDGTTTPPQLLAAAVIHSLYCRRAMDL